MAQSSHILILSRRPSPLGLMLLLTDEEGRLRALDWEDCAQRMYRLLGRHYANPVTIITGEPPAAVVRALDAYFDGHPDSVDDLAVATGGTAFQRSVWAALRGIPCGRTTSYGGIAAAIGRPSAARAVGMANGANPIGIVVPCHRVIGGNGALTGYAGGIERKRWLLAHEGAR